MRFTPTSLAVALGLSLSTALTANAQTKPTAEVTLTRLQDCGTSAAPTDVGARFSDTYAYNGLTVQLVFSCYLIKHGDDYMLWDTGHAMTAGAVAPKITLIDQLAKLNIKPEQIKFVGISHYHADHTGQVASFPNSTLLIGKGDWDSINSATPIPGTNVAPFGHWKSGAGKLEALAADKDVFGDGTIVILNTPGHTPGHHSILLRLKDTGNVLITGDLTHFHENYESNGVPSFNTHRGDTLAALDRFKKIAANLKATVIIQHDARDVSKLPVFPVAAK